MNGHKAAANKCDVLIVGAGPLGWTCSQLLAKRNIRTIVIDPRIENTDPTWLRRGLGVFWPSLNDPPTRAIVAHGEAMALWLQNHCRQGLEQAINLLPGSHLQPAWCWRIGILPHEIEELNRACEMNIGIKKSGFAENFYLENCDSFIWRWQNNSVKIPTEKKLSTGKKATVVSISESMNGCATTLDTGEILASEMVIFANGYQISGIEPWLAEMLVPMSDIETFWQTGIACSENEKPVTFRTASGHVAAALLPEKNKDGRWMWTIRLSGPRFLLQRTGVGIDLTGKPVDDALTGKIRDWLKTQLLPTLTERLNFKSAHSIELELKNARFGVDCLPCDELPILGELGQSGRILASTGWLGCGWSASIQSAIVLAEIIETGKSTKLAPLLRPRRWRSGLNEDGVTGMT